jgi:hypothetical protein
MFVRVIRPGIEKVIECDSFDITHYEAREQGELDYVVLELKPSRETFSVEKSSSSEIYIMNNQGQTVDRYRWNQRKEV